MLPLLFLISCFYHISLATNIDTKVSPILKRGSAASYFGYSVTGVNSDPRWIAVGSPKASTDKAKQYLNQEFNATGALFKCPITMNHDDCVDISVFQQASNTLNPTDGWYGVSVDSNEAIVTVCSHRLSANYKNQFNSRTGYPGMCYFINPDTLDYDGGVDEINRENIKDFQGDNTNIEVRVSSSRSRFGMAGLGSVAIDDPIGRADFFVGAVGERYWQGAAVFTRTIKYTSAAQAHSYGGYSIAVGKFFKGAKTAGLAVGAPRHNLTGAVLLYETLGNDDKPKKMLTGQYGSYFGMALCASDFDGDKIDEIVVGAPYYTESLGKPASGGVFIYGSKNDFASPILELKPKASQARTQFGRSVGVVGDMDLDGFNDLAIGAPYEESGAIYIYQGSSEGLSSLPVQDIRASDLPYAIKTFGWAIKGEIDLDDNGYPDMITGAYGSDVSVILRSVPVVEVDSKYNLSPARIDVSKRDCNVDTEKWGSFQTVCVTIEVTASYKDRADKMKDDIELTFSLDADTLIKDKSKRRVIFEKTQESSLEVEKAKVKDGKDTVVFKETAFLRTDLCSDCEDLISPFPDIQFKLRSLLPGRGTPPKVPDSGPLPDLEKYFQMPFYTQVKDFHNVTETSLSVNRACDPCEPDLKIENVGTTKIPVNSPDVQLEIKISNKADQAYGVELMIDFPSPLYARICGKLKNTKNKPKCLWEPDCEILNNATRMLCSLGSIAKTPKYYVVEVATAQASKARNFFNIPMNVSSGSKEKEDLLADNSIEVKLTVESKADISLYSSGGTESLEYGGKVRGQFSMTTYDDIGLPLEHRYVVENKGPDLVPAVNFTIDWPYEAGSGKHLLYLTGIQEDTNLVCSPAPGVVDSLQSQFKTVKKEILEGSNRTRRDVNNEQESTDKAKRDTPEEAQRGGTRERFLLDCQNNTAKCVRIPCKVTNLKKGQRRGVTIKARVWNSTLLEDYPNSVIRVYSSATIEELTGYVMDDNSANDKTQTSTSFFPSVAKTTKKGIAVWIIVVSAIAGVVLLIILIVIFKMCGFFKRMDTAPYDQVPQT